MHEDVSTSAIGRERIYNVSVLADMMEIRKCLKTSDMFSYDDVNDVITEIIVF